MLAKHKSFIKAAALSVSLMSSSAVMADSSVRQDQCQDQVQCPDEAEQMTVFEAMKQRPELSTLVSLVEAAGLDLELSAEGPLTIFAPQNEALAALDSEILDALSADTELLRSVLLYHVVPGKYEAEDVVQFETLETAAGDTFVVTVTDEGAVKVGGASVLEVDIEADNGVIHVIDGVLLAQGIGLGGVR